MKKYNITVNGKTYEVEVEELGGVAAPARPQVAAPAPKAAPQAAPAPAAPKSCTGGRWGYCYCAYARGKS